MQAPERSYSFRHALTRDAAYQSILRRQRQIFHRQVGAAIEALFADRLEEEAHRLAHHFDQAGDRGRALKYYTLAGDVAARLYANAEAVTHYQHAKEIAELDSVSNDNLLHLYVQLGRTQEDCGQHDHALATYTELETLAQKRDDPAMRLAGLLRRATVHATYTKRFDPERGRTLSDQSLALAQEVGDYEAQAKAFWNLMLLEKYAGLTQQALTYGEQSLAIARQHNLRQATAYALHDLANIYVRVGREQDALAAFSESQTLWRVLNNYPMLADGLNASAWAYAYLGVGDKDEAFSMAEEGLRISRSIDNLWGQAHSLSTLGPLYLEGGQFAPAMKALTESIPLAEAANFVEPQVVARTFLASLYGLFGQVERGLEMAQVGLERAGEMAISIYVLLVQIRLHLQEGNLAGASETLEAAQAKIEQAFGPEPTDLQLPEEYPLLNGLEAEIALAEGAYDRALSLPDHALSLIGDSGGASFVADLLRLKGEALLGQGRIDEAYLAFSQARIKAEQAHSKRNIWQILYVLSLPWTRWKTLFALSQIEAQRGNLSAAANFRTGAAAIIRELADQAGSSELRASFLAMPTVSAVLEISEI